VSAESLKAQRERVVEHLLELAELPADAARDNRGYWRVGLRELQRAAMERILRETGHWSPAMAQTIDALLDRGE
jgi:hypothetical protein